MKKLNDGEFYNLLEKKIPYESAIEEELANHLKHEFILSKIKIFSGSLLDVGCSSGYYGLDYKNGPYLGVDIAEEAIKTARKKVLKGRFWTGDAQDLHFLSRNSVDNVLCSEVIEHLPKPGRMLKEIKRVIKPGGRVLFTCPNFFWSRPGWVTSPIQKFYGLEKTFYHTAYRPSELALILKKTGFEVLEFGLIEKEAAIMNIITYLPYKILEVLSKIFESQDIARFNYQWRKWFQLKFYKLIKKARLNWLLNINLGPLTWMFTRSYALAQKPNGKKIKVGIAGDKVVKGKALITGMLLENGVDAREIKVKKHYFLLRPKKIELIQWYDTKSLRECDIVHAVFPFHTFQAVILAKLYGKKVVVHWIGTDVWYLKGRLTDNLKTVEVGPFFYKIFYKFLQFFIDCHLCGSKNLKQELSLAGIRAKIVPIISLDKKVKIKSFPKRITVLSYIPKERHEFYGSKILTKLAEEFNKVNFVVVGGFSGKETSNIKYFSYIENMEDIYKNTTVVLRIPEHDGMSLVVLEGLQRGKQVIWNYKFPYCYLATNYEEVKKALEKIIQKPELNYKGADYVNREFSSKKISKRLKNIYQKLLPK